MTKLHEYNLNGYPGLPAEFITELGNNRTFGINLEAFRTQYRSPLESLPVVVRESLLTGVVVCITIISLMYVLMLVLERAGVDEEAMQKKREARASLELQQKRKTLDSARKKQLAEATKDLDRLFDDTGKKSD